MKALISKTLLKNIQPGKKPYEIRDTQLKGFILRVQPSGSMSYIAEYGRAKRITIGKADRLTPAQARDTAKGKLASAAMGEDPKAVELKSYDLETYLDEVYEPWMETHYPKSGRTQVRRIRSLFRDFHEVKLEEIKPWLIQKYRSDRIKSGVTARTVNRDVHALKAALRRASEWGHIPAHPLANLKPLEEDRNEPIRYLIEKEEERLREALDKREEKMRKDRDSGNEWRQGRGYQPLPDLRSVTFSDHLKPLTLLSLNTGVRRGEAFDLRWNDVDLKQKHITIRSTKTHLTRHIPLNIEALQVLKDWKKQSRESDYVFPATDGGRLDNINKSWAGLLKLAKIQKFRWHDLRHTFASKLVMAEVDLNVVRELLGHTDIKMTLRYAHLAPSVKAAAVEKLTQSSPKERQ